MNSEEFFAGFPFKNSMLVNGMRGSIAHGTVTKETDDTDTFGVFIESPEYLIGTKRYDMFEKNKDGVDCVYYSLNKYASLLIKGNPNVFSWLWTPDNLITMSNDYWKMVKGASDIFVSKRVIQSILGYANAQLKLMDRPKTGKRKAITEKYGYDTKAAAHLIMILKQGIEFCDDGRFLVLRPDAEELIKIKTGKSDAKTVKDLAKELMAEIDAKDKNHIPDTPDIPAIDNLLIRIYSNYWRKERLI